MIEPQHPAGTVFKQASDKIAFLESRLTEDQRARYDEFVKRQEREKEEQKKKAARAKAEYDQAKLKAPRLVKNYDTPVKIRDPYLRRMGFDALAEEHKTTRLERAQLEEKLRFLEKLDKEREMAARHESRGHPGEFARAASAGKPSRDFEKAGRYDPATEAPKPQHSSALERAFEKARAQQEQSQQRTQNQAQGQEHRRNRGRGRN